MDRGCLAGYGIELGCLCRVVKEAFLVPKLFIEII